MAVTSAEVAELLQIPVDQVRKRLNQQARKQRIFSPARGLWIPIPPEYRTWGAVPATYFIDHLMRFLERDYYVGWLSAAELHGAAHQRPQVFQVAVNAALAQRDFGRVRLRFVTRSHTKDLPRVQMQTPTGQIWVATPELTALDLVDLPRLSGGLNNVATVLIELAQEPRLNPTLLLEIAREFPVATVRRLGYLLERFEADVDLGPLRSLLLSQPRLHDSPLDPRAPLRGERVPAWNVVVNAAVEPDL
ncbi:MAG: type IV toxin-antitoxin system AbiEi family antitoxin [Dehalococcoidia bacterium]|nr:type IV toxin-antitoxin system AbiEi family antitoxin [Dehalococcoidia bacterium]